MRVFGLKDGKKLNATVKLSPVTSALSSFAGETRARNSVSWDMGLYQLLRYIHAILTLKKKKKETMGYSTL